MLTGQNGILNRAAEAKKKTELAQEDENKTLQGYEDIMDQYTGNLPSRDETKPYFPNSNFSYKEGDLNSSLVIKDEDGNEYVWVEVPKTVNVYPTAGLKITNFTDEEYTKIEDDLKEYTKDYKNNDYNDTNAQFIELYKNMLKSVYTNGGFWIGRYEAGYEIDKSKGETVRYYGDDYNTEHQIIQKMVIKKNTYPYNWVRRDQAQELAIGMNYEKTTSSLIFGIQWDLVLKYIETKNPDQKSNLILDSKKIGNYNNNLWNITNGDAKFSNDLGNDFTVCPYKKTLEESVLLTTGADTSFSLMNIYDLAGNVWEWTLEFFSTIGPCVRRGGSYGNEGSSYPMKNCHSNDTNYSDSYIGFRIGLWK